ncbi:hypothetical protein CYMTET_56202 [Cymbomonas tetramitiformis]|uniref:Uncharacterized protein n=1 Tax=Cymbomonas tetramitiformis TaxID=36881 RepID=A0AAE0BBF3_9CHLO|nr:hypothetical protein CYMTET_56202 [Cymbomonas tetramitiformis]
MMYNDVVDYETHFGDPGRCLSNHLRSAKRRNTLDDDEVKELFLAALDPGFYAPVVSRLFTHQQRAAVDLLTIQQWVLECYARHVAAGTHTASFTLSAAAVATDGDASQLSDLTAIILDVKRQLKVLTDKVNGRGFTPRADKNKIGSGGGGSGVRFAAGDLPTGGSWPQSQDATCKKDEARHWHRDCPNGGKHGAGGSFHSFSLGDIENDLLAEQFQAAMDERDDGRFDALCLLAGGKPEMLDGVSACSFGIEPEREDGALQDFLPYCQPATHMGGFTVGGVGSGVSAAACTHVREDAPPAPPPAAIEHVYPDESEASDASDMMPVDPMHAHEPDLCFADKIARMGGLSVTAEGRDFAMRYMHTASVESEEEWTGPPDPFCPPVTRTFADFIENTGIALVPDEPAPSMNLLSAVEEPERVMDYKPATYSTSDDDDEDDSVALPRPRYGCGSGIPSRDYGNLNNCDATIMAAKPQP